MSVTLPRTEIDPRYSIGIPEMDVQHAHWVKLILAFRSVGSEHLLEQSGIDAAAIALEELLKYTRVHFASEEALLAKCQYPGLPAHKRRHGELEGVVAGLLAEIRGHTLCSTPLKLNLFATVWLLEHIMQEDAHYARFILGRAPAPPSVAQSGSRIRPASGTC
jgi:hemerythrin